MPENNQPTTLRSVILDEIKKGQLRMRPKWHFVLRNSLLITGGVILFLVLLYLVSFVAFVLRQNGVWFVPIFGLRGWLAFMISLPWLLIGLSLVFMVILELLVRHCAFAYHRPLLYSLLGIMLVVLAGSFLVNQTTLHLQLAQFSEKHPLLLTGPFYRGFGHERFRDIHPGLITGTTTNGIVIQTERGETLYIGITPHTRLPLGMDFTVGDVIVVFGDRDDDLIEAYGIRRVPIEPMMPMMRRYAPRY
ncbi:MAG: hypothetical protein HY422_00520 [Candidatus Komeilibacteria bacterium]|nr:hypothetical protein [Candidatus Komeilibacteria bacterium]